MKQVTLDGKPFAHQTADVNGRQRICQNQPEALTQHILTFFAEEVRSHSQVVFLAQLTELKIQARFTDL